MIADLGMPEISGDTMLTRMLEIRPDLLILICSGSPFYVSNLPKALRTASGLSAKTIPAEDDAGGDRKATGEEGL